MRLHPKANILVALLHPSRTLLCLNKAGGRQEGDEGPSYRRISVTVALLVLTCALLAGCSRGSRTRDTGLAQAPVVLPAAPEPASPAPEEALPPQDAEEEEEPFPEIAFDPEEPALSDDEVALLDELIGLDLPDSPPEPLMDEEEILHTSSALPLVMNADVKRRVNYFTRTRRGMATIRVSLGRSSAYRPMIERILMEEDLPVEIFYLAMAESGFLPKARSHAQAVGMWQFISSRGKQYGLRQDRYQDLRYDAETATRAAAKHLRDLYIEFDDWYLAMAAYNCGPNRVKSAIRRTGSRDYWTLVRRRALPGETRAFVPIILAMTYVGKNLDLFDLGEIDYAPELRYDSVRTDEEVSFELIADVTGSSVEVIKDLNKSLFRAATPPYGYDLRLPPGTEERFAREIALVPPDKRKHWRRYEVQEGETLQAIASRYKVKPDELVALNSLPGGTALAPGTRLTVPTTTTIRIYRYYGGGGAGGLLEPGTGRYRIASGDTLGGIARRFRTTVQALMSWNGLSSTRIRAGRYLIVQQPGTEGTAVAASSSGSAPTGRYTVRRGDSLSKIGARVGASVSQLRAWNGIRGSTIVIGQVLKVPGPAPAAPPPASRASSATAPRRAAASKPAPGPNHYLIRRGDSLALIAARFGVSVSDIQRWNGIRGTKITAGEYLLVRPQTATDPASSTTGYYLVRSGDNLGLIARRHNTTVADLMRWNGLRSTRINPGQRLAVGGPAASADEIQHYRIRKGDNLAVIARRFNVTVDDLKRWNGLRSTVIHAGRTLEIRRSGS